MKKILTVAFSTLLFSSVSYGQAQPEVSKPATKLGAFEARTGIVVVRGYTEIGHVGGLGTVTVNAREFRDAGNSKTRLTGISIAVKESGRLERENSVLIDSDEIDSLVAGLDYISKATKDITQLTNFEMEYRTKGNFSITVFNNSRGEISAAVSAGHIGKTNVFITLPQVSELRQLILDAKTKI